MALKQRNDPYYFLFAICAAILVYFLYYNVEGASSATLAVVESLPATESIRKIADSKDITQKPIFQLKSNKIRQPAMAESTELNVSE